MSNNSFAKWLKEDLRKKGYVGAEQEGRLHKILYEIPASLQELAWEALHSRSAKLSLELYIQSLRDHDERIQMKRELLSRYIVEAKEDLS